MFTLLLLDSIKILANEFQKTLYQVLRYTYYHIPHFCYNKNLFISGNCRICLVEIINIPKPVVSCSIPVTENLTVFTRTPFAAKSRENVLEFLLLNHPLDCPVCDQGGECDLQEYSELFGQYVSRLYMSRNAISSKLINGIETNMNRCINCKKCVNLSHVLGLKPLSLFGRSLGSEIYNAFSIFVLKKILELHELSGNIFDICPVSKKNKRLNL